MFIQYTVKKTYVKAKICSKFRRRASLLDRVVNLILHAKAKACVFADEFRSYFIGRGFAYCSES